MTLPTIPFDALQSQLAATSAEELLGWAAGQFGSDVVFACSFGAEDVVLLDLIVKLAPKTPVFVLDTGRLNQETYDVMDRCRDRYGIEFEIYSPETQPLQGLLRQRGPNSFYRSIEDRKLCCGIRKVEPLRRALTGRKAWITGLRRAQAVTRASLPKIEVDEAHGGIYKLNPLSEWSEEEVWAYIRAHDVPYNALHDQGFPSIGCAPCTRAIAPGEDVRAGRWWWEAPEHKECGLHVKRKTL
ncbi:MAG: phosphoadenylyl-sulfate reductase [Fimbriimonas sp.]